MEGESRTPEAWVEGFISRFPCDMLNMVSVNLKGLSHYK